MWYSSADQSWAKNTLTRDVAVPAGASDARFWMWNDYTIEEDWDFGFVEVSTDGGTTWSEQVVKDATGKVVTTPDGYADPNGRMTDFGDKKYGLTGATDGWRHDYVDLTPYAGKNVKVRLMYATDEAFEDRGWFVDDLSVTNGDATIWSDDAEANNGWTPTVGTLRRHHRCRLGPRHGHLERQPVLPRGVAQLRRVRQGPAVRLRHTYQAEGAWKVEKIKYNAPGALVWYRDTSYGNNNHVLNNLTSLPSEGAKGGLLIVDSHFDPLRRTGAAAALDTSTLKNLPSRPQSSNAAFGLQPTYPFKECVTNGGRHGRGVHELRGPGAREHLHGRQGLVPRLRDPRQQHLLPRRRRLHGGPVAGQPAVLHPRGGCGGQGADAVLRRRHRCRDAARHGQPGRRRCRLQHQGAGREDLRGQPVRADPHHAADPLTG